VKVKVKVKVKSRKCGIEVGEMTSRSGWENGEGEKINVSDSNSLLQNESFMRDGRASVARDSFDATIGDVNALPPCPVST
jgi:hypothetical protein